MSESSNIECFPPKLSQSKRRSINMSDSGGAVEAQGFPIECVAQFYMTQLEPRATSVDFSMDGFHCVTSHEDDALRWVDVGTMQHRETLRLPHTGAHRAYFTTSSDRLWLAPKNIHDPYLYVISATKSEIAAAYSLNCESIGSSGAAKHRVPLYSALHQSPTTELLAAVHAHQDRLLLFHPLTNRPVAATSSGQGTSHHGARCVQFSDDGVQIALGCADVTALLDTRMLHKGPILVIRNTSVFTNSALVHRHHCAGVEFATNRQLLMTSHLGEAVFVDSTTALPQCSLFGGHSMRHFGSEHSCAIAARLVGPASSTPMVVQPGMALNVGRHLLFYDASQPDGALQVPPLRMGQLLYSVQSRDSEVPKAMAVVKSRSGGGGALVAVCSKGMYWWTTAAC